VITPPPAWQNGVAVDYSATIWIGGGGYSNTAGGNERDIYHRGCIMKSLEITHAIDSESGKPVANCVFVTGYPPTYHDGISDGNISNSWTSLTGESATDFISWSSANTYISSNADGYEIHPYSYSVSCSRDIQRLGCVDYTDFKPDGYVMNQGTGWDISMTMVYKRDENFANFLSQIYDNTTAQIRFSDSSSAPLNIRIYGKISEHSVDTGSPELRNSITVKGMGDIEGSGVILQLMM